jgi:sulfonate transport system ATP-binding protein
MLTIANVTKRFDTGTVALERIDLRIEPGEIVAIVGTTGCGKSTLLRLIGGLERPSAGRILIDGRPVEGPRPEVGFVFQEPRLMPWLDVEANVAFGLGQLPKEERHARATAALAKVGLTQFAKAYPRALSGGMAQRTALARALVTEPEILLLDEPFSALDAFTRTKLQDHLVELWEAERRTFLLVTHDLEEAIALADRVLVMRGHPGRIHREVAIDLPRRGRRAALPFQRLKTELAAELDLDAAAA